MLYCVLTSVYKDVSSFKELLATHIHRRVTNGLPSSTNILKKDKRNTIQLKMAWQTLEQCCGGPNLGHNQLSMLWAEATPKKALIPIGLGPKNRIQFTCSIQNKHRQIQGLFASIGFSHNTCVISPQKATKPKFIGQRRLVQRRHREGNPFT